MLLHVVEPGPVFLRQRLADRAQIIARIEPVRNVADILAERLAVAQEGRARQHVDLRAGVVYVIFPCDIIAGKGEQIGERIAEHRPARMPDMHRPGRVGRDIFDIGRLGLAHVRAPIILAPLQHRAQHTRPERLAQGQVDETGPGNLELGDIGIVLEPGNERGGNIAGRHARGLGEHHGRIRGDVAVRRIARRLDRQLGQVDLFRQDAVRLQGEPRLLKPGGEMRKYIHDHQSDVPKRAAQRGYRLA